MERPRIELQNIGKYYYSETSVTQALRKINLSFRMGEFVAITGESGSGKSTLLKMISGIDTFDEGEMFINGEPTFQYDDDDWEQYRRQEIGFVFQDYSLIGHYSARENIVSALLIMGMELEEAGDKAEDYLEQVGLKGFGDQMASKLSSGQKQRLSIARALAKGTDIIVADEPTGNLDSETGEQIIQLLKKLSADHLVIMVTHNYDMVAPYVTRKVRLHDGELVLDVLVNEGETGAEADADKQSENPHRNEQQKGEIEQQREKQTKEEKEQIQRKRVRQVAAIFSKLNTRTQKGKAVLFTAFFLITAVVSFLFIGELLMNEDDCFTKEYDSSAFYHKDDTRLVVKRQDAKEITKKDQKRIEKLANVEEVDPYDTVNDINYYIEENVDYEFQYGYSDNSDEDSINVEFLHENRFMKSVDCISKEDLAAGKLPEKRDEIVLYSKEGSDSVGQVQSCYFSAKNIWGGEEYYLTDVKVVGILKEKTDQIYFSSELCQMLAAGVSCGKYALHYYWDMKQNKFLGQSIFVPVINDDLKGNEMRISKYFDVPPDGYDLLPREKEFAFGGNADYLEIQQYKEDGQLETEGSQESAEAVDTKNFHSSTGYFLEVSPELFSNYNDGKSMQASVYITSYAKTDKVIKALQKQGYDAISTYRISSTKYIPEKVNERLTLIVIAIVVLVILFLAEVLILRSLMKIRVKDYFVMKFMGMKMKLMRKISYHEMRKYCLTAIVLVIVLMQILGQKISLVHEMLYYYDVLGYVWFVAYNLVVEGIMVASFNHLLKGRMDE